VGAVCNLIGQFGDARRRATGSAFLARIVSKGTLIVKRLACGRAEQVRFERFLWSEKVTVDEMKEVAVKKTAQLANNCEHVLCFQDSTEVELNRQGGDVHPSEMGVLKNRNRTGFYVHPVLAMDAADDFVFGIAGVNLFDYERNRQKLSNYKMAKMNVEDKKSNRWISSAHESFRALSGAKKVTIIGDRENDFYEFFARAPEKNFHILVRSKGVRTVKDNGIENGRTMELRELVNFWPSRGTKFVEIESRAESNTSGRDKRPAREKRNAELEIRYGTCSLQRSLMGESRDPKELTMSIVDVAEINVPSESSSEPIRWTLITSHQLKSAKEAWEIVEWYRKRWHIEQLFRTAKKGGMRIEEIELSKGESIKKLCFLGLLASVKILQLTLCRDGKIERPADDIFSSEELQVLEAATKKYEGKTEKQKNPHKIKSVAWSHWTLGRLGGWKGYIISEGPAGPTTIKRGLDELHSLVRGWQLAKEVCIT
jgi:hypothetical protein